MASILLASAGSALGASIGGSILGVSAATIGGAVGSFAGSLVDSWIVSQLTPGQRIEGARLENLAVTTSTEGAVIPRVWGRMRLGGNIIWATDFTEHVSTTTQGGKGGGPKVTTTSYSYTASFAVALCEGPISGIGRVWADGKPLDLTGVTWRLYTGDEAQTPDPFIEARMGAENAPAYRGTAYVMFEELDLTPFGNRLPQLSFEVFRPLIEADSVEGMLKAVTLIPGTGEFVYGTTPVLRGSGGSTASENVHTTNGVPDIVAALDQLQAAAPNIESVSLVVSWFGTDLRAGNCQIMPGVENATKQTTPVSWSVNGVSRASAHQISLDATGKLAFGGTPSDATIVEAIKEIKARGLRVTFYPFLLMDIPAGNVLPNPYSDNATGVGQDAYPWRGRITCSPAAGFVGTVDKTAAAGTQVSAFFGNASAADFAVSGETVSWTGGNDWGYRRFILHYAHLCAAAGGVDAFLLGSELKGLTTIRDGAASYPAVAELKRLAGDVANLVTVSTGLFPFAITFQPLTQLPSFPGDEPSGVIDYGGTSWATFPDVFGAMPSAPSQTTLDGTTSGGGTVLVNIDLLALGISAADIDAGGVTLDFSAVQNFVWGGPYLQLRAFGLPDANGAPGFMPTFAPLIFDQRTYSDATNTVVPTSGSGTVPPGSRWVQLQIVMTDGITVSNPIVQFSLANAAVTSGFVGYAADWSEYFGHQPKDGSNDLFFHLDPLWASPDVHFIGIDNYLPLSDWRDGPNHLDAQAGWSGVRDLGYLKANIEGGEQFDWFYASSADRTAQTRTIITDSAYAKPWVFRPKDIRAWWSNPHFERPGGIENPTPTAWVPESKPIRFTELGCPAVDRGTNQPNVFYDPKSSESALPYFSRGWQDEALQRRYLEAMLGYWGDTANNPVSSITGKPMIDMSEAAVWTWDARPFPDFPARENIWADAPNWRLGHWLTGRLGAVGLGALVRDLCRAAGLPDTPVDVSELSDIVPGFVVSALESPRASIATLARHFGFDAIETGGKIVFRARGRAAVTTLAPDQMVGNGEGEVMELTRGQETELPQALKWQLVRADEEYDAATVEARRVTVQAARVSSESFPLAVSLEEADRRCRRALMEAWVGRETLTAKLSPSLLRLDPGDVISLSHDGRLIDYRITRIADASARAIEAIRSDAKVYDLPPGQYRPASLPSPTVFGPPEVALMDLPQISDSVPAHRPYTALFAGPWYGTAAVWRSASTSGFALLDTVGTPAKMGTLAADLPAGPLWRFDAGSELLVDLTSGTLVSVTDTELLNGANALAVESAPNVWEIIQFGAAELVSAGRYRLTRLLRGQRGTEDAMGNPASAGARVVVLDNAVQSLPIPEADLGIPWNWRIGPRNAAPTDAIMEAVSFTPAGRGLMPFAPAQARMRRLANGDLAIRWIRRDRALSADSWVLADAPMSEASESYDLEILSSGAVVRTVTGLTTSTFTYTAATQATDFGGAVTSLDLRITQIGALGRGVPFSTTLKVTEAT